MTIAVDWDVKQSVSVGIFMENMISLFEAEGYFSYKFTEILA